MDDDPMSAEKCCVTGCGCDATQMNLVAVSYDTFRTIHTCERHVKRVKAYDVALAKAWRKAIEPDTQEAMQ